MNGENGIFATACPRNCYSSCSFLARIRDGKLVAIEPNPANRATAGGPCLKGLAYVERTHSANRITEPMRRTADGFFRAISWENALDEIAQKLQAFREQYGPQSILYYESSGTAGLMNQFGTGFWQLFGGATTTYGNLCWPAGLEAVRLTLGENKHNAPWDLEHARLIILWGKNPAETNIHQMVFIEKAAAAGAKVIVIDPRRTASSERADLLIQPRPGTDAAIALAIANHLITHDLFDRDFVGDHVYGFGEFSDSIRNWTLEKAAALSDVPMASIAELAHLIATIQPMTLVAGYGMQRFSNGGQTVRALLALNVITGNIGKQGACFLYANLQSYVFDTIKEPLSYDPAIDPDPLLRRSVSKSRLGEDIMAQRSPSLKMAWIERGNPVSQNPGSKKIMAALRQLEFRVVVEEFLTDTAREADIILPAKNMFEQPDIIGCYWHPYIQYKPALVEPPPGIKAESEIWFLLARRLGYSGPQIERIMPSPGNENTLKFLRNQVADIMGLDWDKLVEGPLLAPGWEEIAFGTLKFGTPTGKIELWSDVAASKWLTDPLPGYTPLPDPDGEYPFFLMTPNNKNRIHSQFGNLSLIRQFDPGPQAMINATDAMNKRIRQGDSIRIFNENGSLITKAAISFSLKQGCVVYCNGYWNSEGGSPNLLTSGRETDMGYGTAFHDTRVQIEKA